MTEPLTADVFRGTFSSMDSAQADATGVYRAGVAAVARRYDDFILSANFTLVTTPTPRWRPGDIVGDRSLKKLYLLRQTTLTVASASSVQKCKRVTVSGVLKYATNAGLVADGGEKVIVQTRSGKAARRGRRCGVGPSPRMF